MTFAYTVVVPAYNASETLRHCLKAIVAVETPPSEIIVFDDGSSDNTSDIARALGAKIIHNKSAPVGPARGRNAAVDKAENELILFVDADIVIDPQAPSRLFEELQKDRSIAAAFGSYGTYQATSNRTAHYANLRHHFFHQSGSREAETFWTGIGAVRRPDFLEVGGFNNEMARPLVEDIDLGYRLRDKGYRIRLVPEAQGTHLKNWSLNRLWHDDIFARAIPWSKMIVAGRGKESLNVTSKEKVSAILAHLIWLTTLLCYVDITFAFAALTSTGLYIAMNWQLFTLLHKHAGLRTAIPAVGLHWAYHLYSSITFAAISVRSKLKDWRKRRPITSAYSAQNER